MKYAAVLLVIGIFLLVGCAQSELEGTACTMEAKECPDGSYVGRTGPNCEFEACPGENSECDYTSTEKNYVGRSSDECSRIKFACKDNEAYFNDGCGCGCRKIDTGKRYVSNDAEECKAALFKCDEGEEPFFNEDGCGCQPVSSGKLVATNCSDPGPGICTQQYDPACGWFDPAKIQCIKYPCAQTFSNSCHACADEKVISWTPGECPSG